MLELWQKASSANPTKYVGFALDTIRYFSDYREALNPTYLARVAFIATHDANFNRRHNQPSFSTAGRTVGALFSWTFPTQPKFAKNANLGWADGQRCIFDAFALRHTKFRAFILQRATQIKNPIAHRQPQHAS